MPWVMVIEHGRRRRRRCLLARASALLSISSGAVKEAENGATQICCRPFISLFISFDCCCTHCHCCVCAYALVHTHPLPFSQFWMRAIYSKRPALESRNNSEPLSSSFLFLLLFALPGETSYVLLLCSTVMQEPFLPFQGPSYMYDQRVKRIRCNCNSISQAKAISFVEIACRVSFSGSPVIGRRPGRVPRSFFVIIIFSFIFFFFFLRCVTRESSGRCIVGQPAASPCNNKGTTWDVGRGGFPLSGHHVLYYFDDIASSSSVRAFVEAYIHIELVMYYIRGAGPARVLSCGRYQHPRSKWSIKARAGHGPRSTAPAERDVPAAKKEEEVIPFFILFFLFL